MKKFGYPYSFEIANSALRMIARGQDQNALTARFTQMMLELHRGTGHPLRFDFGPDANDLVTTGLLSSGDNVQKRLNVRLEPAADGEIAYTNGEAFPAIARVVFTSPGLDQQKSYEFPLPGRELLGEVSGKLKIDGKALAPFDAQELPKMAVFLINMLQLWPDAAPNADAARANSAKRVALDASVEVPHT